MTVLRAAGAVLTAVLTAVLAACPAPAAVAAPQGAAAAGVRPGLPAVLTIRTVPALRDVGVDFDGNRYRTDGSGQVTITTRSGWYPVRIIMPGARTGISVRFARWLDGIALPRRVYGLPAGPHVLEVGLVISRPVSFRFTDERGHPVPRAQVSRIVLANGQGGRLSFNPVRRGPLLPGNRISRGPDGLVPFPIRYSVTAVDIDGTDVVHNGSQQFTVRRARRPWTVRVLLFPLRITVRDALFKFGAGEAVRLTMPDGASRTVRLGTGHSVTLDRLPRGSYSAASQGAGLGLSAPVALSSPQSATLLLLSWQDIAVVLGFALLFLVGLPIAGGRVGWLRRPTGKRRRA